jgi:hypothetical protein
MMHFCIDLCHLINECLTLTTRFKASIFIIHDMKKYYQGNKTTIQETKN